MQALQRVTGIEDGVWQAGTSKFNICDIASLGCGEWRKPYRDLHPHLLKTLRSAVCRRLCRFGLPRTVYTFTSMHTFVLTLVSVRSSWTTRRYGALRVRLAR